MHEFHDWILYSSSLRQICFLTQYIRIYWLHKDKGKINRPWKWYYRSCSLVLQMHNIYSFFFLLGVVACFVVSRILLKSFSTRFIFIYFPLDSHKRTHHNTPLRNRLIWKLNQYKNCNQKILKLVRHEIEWIGNIVWKIEEYLAFSNIWHRHMSVQRRNEAPMCSYGASVDFLIIQISRSLFEQATTLLKLNLYFILFHFYLVGKLFKCEGK